MRQKDSYRNVLHLTDYGAPYEGNFVASLRALEAKLNAGNHGMTYVFPPRAAEKPWAQNMRREKDNVFILERDSFFSYIRQIRQLLKQNDVDILHVHFIHYREKIASLLAARTCGHRVKLVVHLHNHLDLPKSFLRALPQRLYLAQADRFVCCSGSVARRLIADGIPAKKVDIAENAIAFERLDAFVPLERASLGVPEGAKIVLMFGFDFYRKGVDVAVDAVRLLRERLNKDFVLAVVLSSRKEEAERNILAQLGVSVLPEWILLLPPRSDVGRYYRFADVFVSPSREEGFCYALVEAAYCKTPIVGSAIDAQKDLQLSEYAFCIPGDASSLAEAILLQLGFLQEDTADIALEAAKERAVQTYSLSAWTESVLRAYDAMFVDRQS